MQNLFGSNPSVFPAANKTCNSTWTSEQWDQARELQQYEQIKEQLLEKQRGGCTHQNHCNIRVIGLLHPNNKAFLLKQGFKVKQHDGDDDDGSGRGMDPYFIVSWPFQQ